MDQNAKAAAFRDLHVRGDPLVLWNIWDAGSAKAVAEAGAPAIATGSWSVAAAQGLSDGQCLSMDAALHTARQIVEAVGVPVSVDFEGCYADSPQQAADNACQLMKTGAIGLNYEDRVIGGDGLHGIAEQSARIGAIRAMADDAGCPFFVNARTDIFFNGQEGDPADLLAELLDRAAAYSEAGADGLFVPGLAEPDLIARVCETVTLPVNVMRMGEMVELDVLAEAGVARVSHGPGPYLEAMKTLSNAASEIY